MSDKIKIELSAEYAEHLELLKQIIPNAKGEEIVEDSEMVEALIDSFMAFIQEQAGEFSEGGCCGGHDDEGCCGGKKHDKEDKGHGGCGCGH